MTTRIAINGFGRIGRLTLRRILSLDTDLEVVAINDLTQPKVLAHLFRFDTAFGQFDGSVDYTDDAIIINGKAIKVYAEKDAKHLPWGDDAIDVVVESTGFYTSQEKSQAHLDAGAKKVLISGPAGNMKTIVYNVNDAILDANDTIISVASCTTNALAPMAKALNDAYGIEVGTMTTIHAYTGNQALVDGPKGLNLRGARAAAGNIVPYTTGAAKAIGLVLPELNGKLQGHSHRVPVIDGSVVELVSILRTKVSEDDINALMKNVTENNPSFGYTDLEIVSSDVIGSTYGSLFDATQTEVTTVNDYQLVKTVAWYDNEFGFVTQLVRALEKYATL
ncbi:type I glyceraldehyde-3-phosphate dehydrogenase [Erysipelothrix sp. HDW6C]|uniref:type I glyceraldehyde-3-phosphate dehydrogenase n=1 Tax=Erysipelothrix sp. HDW6C TaxID=2714930 RepID=UPI0014084DCA|nr:type I glyceraldehyde-3-phosphate dehydrogenase [Erysipelothrix sp. HDW6C]QIK70304.1 type I glyceraldehyde-3-phosphate dehydrogenase [Erysipelothrix sp. HDW6C]